MRGRGDRIASRWEYSRRFRDDPVPRNWRDGGVLSRALFLWSLVVFLGSSLHACYSILRLGWRGRTGGETERPARRATPSGRRCCRTTWDGARFRQGRKASERRRATPREFGREAWRVQTRKLRRATTRGRAGELPLGARVRDAAAVLAYMTWRWRDRSRLVWRRDIEVARSLQRRRDVPRRRAGALPAWGAAVRPRAVCGGVGHDGMRAERSFFLNIFNIKQNKR